MALLLNVLLLSVTKLVAAKDCCSVGRVCPTCGASRLCVVRLVTSYSIDGVYVIVCEGCGLFIRLGLYGCRYESS